MIYKASVENNNIAHNNDSNSNNTYMIESVCLDELNNYQSMLENCTNRYDKMILEAKVQVLQEVTFKDIKNKIIELWNRFKEAIRKIKDNIKKLFTSKRTKELENRCNMLQRNIHDLQDYSASLARSNNKYFDNLNKMHDKVDRFIDKTQQIINSINDNKYAYFDMNDYIDRNQANIKFDPNTLDNYFKLNSNSSVKDFSETSDIIINNYDIITDKIREKLGDNNAKTKKETSEIITQCIEDDLENKCKNTSYFNNITNSAKSFASTLAGECNFVDVLKSESKTELVWSDQLVNYIDIYYKMIDKLNQYSIKYLDASIQNGIDTNNEKTSTTLFNHYIDDYIAKNNLLISILNQNITCLSIVAKYSNKKAGILEQAVTNMEILMQDNK